MLRPQLMADVGDLDPAVGGTNVLAVVSLITGVLALLSSGCCCVPILSMFSAVLLPVLSLVAIVTGILGLGQAKVTGQGKGLSMAGIGLGTGAIVVALAVMSLSVVAGAASAIFQRMQQ